MRQVAPNPEPLRDLVERLQYKAGWYFSLEDIDRGQGSEGLTLKILIMGTDSYDATKYIAVNHFMPVPPAAYDVRSWQHWLLDQILLVERHEACEFFRLVDAADGTRLARPYAPSHGPGNDPYLIREVGTQEDAETNFRGVYAAANPGND